MTSDWGCWRRVVVSIWLVCVSVCFVDVSFEWWCSWRRPYHVESTGSRPITAVKQRWARSVLAWVTGWEYRVSPAFNNPHTQSISQSSTTTTTTSINPNDRNYRHYNYTHCSHSHLINIIIFITILATLSHTHLINLHHHYPTHCQSISPHLYTIQPVHMKHIQPHTVSTQQTSHIASQTLAYTKHTQSQYHHVHIDNQIHQ